MPTLLYRFDDTDAFPFLETESCVRGAVELRLEGNSPNQHLHLSWARTDGDPPEPSIVMGLPFRAIDGCPVQVLLEVCGDAGGSRLLLEAGDARGWGFAYGLGRIDFRGWRTCAADVQKPCEFWGAHEAGPWAGLSPPVQLQRLKIALDPSCRGVELQFGELTISGTVRITHPGIA